MISEIFIFAFINAISIGRSKCESWIDSDTFAFVLTPTPFPTTNITPSPTSFPSTTSEASNCVISLPTTTLTCKSRQEACKQCTGNQTCVQVGRSVVADYKCPTFKCKECPEPVCDTPCGCKEECVIVKKKQVNVNGHDEHQGNHQNSCPIAKCKALPICLTCPPISCNSVKCKENFECKVKPGSCYECATVTCEPKPCLLCATEPLTCMCPRGKKCKKHEGSCYKCPFTTCVDIPDPCANCKGECSVSSHPNCGESCLPQRQCVEKCRKCSPFLPSWKCKNPQDTIYNSCTCTDCSEYRCINGNCVLFLRWIFVSFLECKDCKKHEPKCDCENQEDCVLQPRSCNQCSTYYCKKGN